MCCSSTATRACTSRSICASPPAALSVAVRADYDYASAVRQGSRLKVATKYVGSARDFFASKGGARRPDQLSGSMELAPLTGLADAIVDLVSTGNTLKANQLVEVERIIGHQRARWSSTGPRSSSSANPSAASSTPSRRPFPPPDLGPHGNRPCKAAPPDCPRLQPASMLVHGAAALVRGCRCRHREGGGRHPGRRADRAATRRCCEYTRRFDGLDAASVSELELTQADFKQALRLAARRAARARCRPRPPRAQLPRGAEEGLGR